MARFPASLALSELGADSEKAHLVGLQIQADELGGYSVYLRAFTSVWENVEAFRGLINQAPGMQNAEVTEQRKEADHGKVFFDLKAKAEIP